MEYIISRHLTAYQSTITNTATASGSEIKSPLVITSSLLTNHSEPRYFNSQSRHCCLDECVCGTVMKFPEFSSFYFVQIFTCVSYAEVRNRYGLDVRLSVTRWHCIKTAKRIVMLSSPHDSKSIL